MTIRKRTDREERAVALAIRYGGVDGEHHKQWVIDQMLRILCAGNYRRVIREAKQGDDGPDAYSWDEGIAP